MAYEQKNGHFTVWKNDKYTQGGNQPYAKGKGLDLSGKDIEVALWIPKSEKIKGFNLTMTEPYNKDVVKVAPGGDVTSFPKDESEEKLPF